MATPFNIIDDNGDLGSVYSKKTVDGKDYYPCWYVSHVFDDYPEDVLTEENLVKLRLLVAEIIYPALQLHTLGIDYLWDRKKKEYIPFKKYRVGLGVTETYMGEKALGLMLECYKTGFTYRSMNHIRRHKAITKARMSKLTHAVSVFNDKAHALLVPKSDTE